MATVYLAIQESFQREVALKIMAPSLAEAGDFSERFLREARIVSRLVHPNIVTVHDVGIQNGHHYMSMEYIDGKDLKTCLADLSEEQLFNVLRDMARALDYAGQKGYIHRDVKPDNIMLHAADGRAVLMDFGIARATDSSHSVTRTGTALGTPHYMSPEQARGRPLDGRSDIYSLGVLLYYMMLGKVPYDAETPVAIGIKHISQPIPRLPEPLAYYQPILDKLMAKKPSERYQSGAELLADMEELDVGPLMRWRQNKGVVDSGGDQPVLVKTTQPGTDNRAPSGKLMSNKSVPRQTAAEVKHSRQAVRRGALDAPVSAEALHIPREDLAARMRPKGSGSAFTKAVGVLVVLLAVAYGLHYQQWVSYPKPITNMLEELEGAFKLVVARTKNTADNLISHFNGGAGDVAGLSGPNRAMIKQLLERADALASDIDERPEQRGELVALYRQVLELDQDQSEALQALEGIKSAVLLALVDPADITDIDRAQQSMADALDWFPELEGEQRFQPFQQRLLEVVKVAQLLQDAEQFFTRDQLLYPTDNNATLSYQAVLELDPDSEAANQGLDKIANRYWELAKSDLRRKELDKALARVKKGLSIRPEHNNLLAIQKNIITSLKREKNVDQLLIEAREFEQQQRLYGPGDNAAQRYLSVQAIDPQRQEARIAIEQILDQLYNDVDNFVLEKNYDEAGLRIQQALVSFPDNDRLLSLLLELESYKPAIENVFLSGSVISDIDAGPPAVLTVYRTLHIAFRYRNLDQPTTVFQATLFDGARKVKIAAAPVVVVGEAGQTQFRIDRPVEGFTEGGYHLDIQLGGKRIFTHAFVINH